MNAGAADERAILRQHAFLAAKGVLVKGGGQIN